MLGAGAGRHHPTFYLSVVTIGELRKGLTILPEGKRRSLLQAWLDNDLIDVSIFNPWGVEQWKYREE